eukprot:TRINITY_DN7025_c0_g1_i1.p1 TRINITY_DN7025_c0_g1~~TRINITY_DN7025_c0_g1_i1.p1  ORF type:complete len:203 (+),score=27.47 TRINITY_DN7025_c0_g1_i1:88-696(+)
MLGTKKKGGSKHQHQLHKYAETTFGGNNLKHCVKLPDGEDLNEWLAFNTLDFYNQISLLHGTISDYCTDKECPTMRAGPKFEYLWADGREIKKAIKVSAPEYVKHLMSWIQKQLDTETIFPSKPGAVFPKNFVSVVQTIFKRLFRVYAHIYHSHFELVVNLGVEAHLNTSLIHFVTFSEEFKLVDKKELLPLSELINCLFAK